MSLRQCLRFIAELAFPASPSASSSAAAPASNADLPSPSAVIFLGVDDITQSKCWLNVMPLLVGTSNSPMNIVGGRRMAVLSLITGRSQSLTFETGPWFDHPINFLPMPAHLPGADPSLLNQLQLGPEFLPTIKVLCRALGNQGRLLEILHDLLQPTASSLVLRQVLLAENENAVDVILRAVVADERGRIFFEKLQEDVKSMMYPVCHAVLGNELGRGEKIPGCSLTPDELRVNGVFIDNVITAGGLISPVMAPLQVLIWAEEFRANSEHPEQLALAGLLIEMFSIKSPFSCMKFEQFHAGVYLHLMCSSY
jgi:hypothetical protein